MTIQNQESEAIGAFNKAVQSGRLSTDIYAWNYAGNYMFMGKFNGRDQFKNIDSRQYLK